ncbi:hypothetical protein SAMN02745181_3526 [Rubritalea squalenifaciens DSM 18772]|uniref:CvpA family protein n=1 Tax=Rubritalea squalenifaciens DSM 18772 TaxID=1123071 RepID=A0A1M6R224_9BACT|nr:hypothetical protein [Rubritalea squalenifaciens]SHK26483.1 hypothetical protein SAMN02745181_3526 [Rubritalea squalenifaciens DSM 18772]
MNIDPSNLTASSLLTAIAVAFALLGFIKGTLKLVLTFITLGSGAATTYFTFLGTTDISKNQFPSLPEWVPLFISLVAGLCTFLLVRTVLRFLLNPFDNLSANEKKGSGAFGMILGTVLALGSLWFGMNQLIEVGSKQEIEYWLAQDSENPPTDLPLVSKIKQAFAHSTVGKHIADFHPIHDPVDHTLVKIAAMRITSTENYTKLATTPTLKETLLQEKVTVFMMNQEVVKAIDENDLKSLLSYPELSNLISDPELKSAIAEIDIEQTLNLR